MQAADQQMLFGTLDDLCIAYSQLRSLQVSTVLANYEFATREHKAQMKQKFEGDTVPIDEIFESILVNGKFGRIRLTSGQRLRGKEIYGGITIYAEEGTLILSDDLDKSHSTGSHPCREFQDPIDGSSYMQLILQQNRHLIGHNVGEILNYELNTLSFQGKTIPHTGAPSSSVSLVRDGTPIFGAVLNLFTGEVAIACDEGVYIRSISEIKTLPDIINKEYEIKFNPRQGDALLCYLGKDSYVDNFKAVHYNKFTPMSFFTTGPNRFMYLSLIEGFGTGVQVAAFNNEPLREMTMALTIAKYHPEIVAYQILKEETNNAFTQGGNRIDFDNPDLPKPRANVLFIHTNNQVARNILETDIAKYRDVEVKQLFTD